MAPKSKKNQLIDEVKRLYIEEQKSLGEIKGILGPSIQTLSRWLGEEGIALAARPRNPNAARTPEQQAEINHKISEAQKNRVVSGGNPGGRPRLVPHETRECANAACEATFQVLETSAQQFCSRTCARVVGNKDRWEGKRKDTICPCGTVFYSPHLKKYCSDICLATYGQKRQRDPENWATLTCQNCNNEFEQRKSSQSYGKYCSNKCAYRHTKTKQHIVVDDAVVLDSGYEAFFWGLCQLLKVPVERYDREQGVEWREGSWYAPDFYLPSLAVAVELKGMQNDQDETRWECFRQKRGDLAVLLREDLQKMAISRQTFIEVLP
jgi:hypothetical protein